jgi:polysaccharide pyruvyl transferase WcaK-like protein
MKILIINSDTVRNRGDRAILAGSIALIREAVPDAEIWSLSENVVTDEAWYGIRFLPVGIFTLNPFKLMQLGIFARTCDVVLWGGGEILKDYTNILSLVYWTVKMSFIRLMNPHIYGFFQGIGATHARFSRFLIVMMVNWTKRFIVRDQESKQRLLDWGVRTPVHASYDPAIFVTPSKTAGARREALAKEAGISAPPETTWIGFGVRRWFHYRQHGWIPFRCNPVWRHQEKKPRVLSPMEKTLADLCDWLIETYQVHIIFFPMHLAKHEADAAVAHRITDAMRHGQHTSCIMHDNMPPQAYIDLFSHCRMFISVRLHSCILATAAKVPTVLFYYSEKGRRFFEQLGLSRFSRPVEQLLEPDAIQETKRLVQERLNTDEKTQEETDTTIEHIRNTLISDITQLLK